MATATKPTIFGLRMLKKYWELTPIVVIIGGACVGAMSMSAYFLATKSDVGVNRTSGIPPWERVNPEQHQKLLTYNIKYEKNEELENLRKEIGSYKC